MHIDSYILLGFEDPSTVQTPGAVRELQYTYEQCERGVTALQDLLVRLKIHRCKRSIFGLLNTLMPKVCPCRLPNLRIVRLCFSENEQPDLDSELLENWTQRALEKGVTFQQIHTILEAS